MYDSTHTIQCVKWKLHINWKSIIDVENHASEFSIKLWNTKPFLYNAKFVRFICVNIFVYAEKNPRRQLKSVIQNKILFLSAYHWMFFFCVTKESHASIWVTRWFSMWCCRKAMCQKCELRVKTWTKRNKQNHYRRLFIYSEEHQPLCSLLYLYMFVCEWLHRSYRKLHIAFGLD